MHGRIINRRIVAIDTNSKAANVDRTFFQTRVKYVSNVVNHFWNRFSKEYLLSLLKKHYYAAKTKTEHRKLRLVHIVLIRDDNVTPRNNWRKERKKNF